MDMVDAVDQFSKVAATYDRDERREADRSMAVVPADLRSSVGHLSVCNLLESAT